MRARLFIAFVLCGVIAAHTSVPTHADDPSKNLPLPDMATLFRDILRHQKEIDEIRKNYIFKASTRDEELDSNGKVKKTTIEERETFFIGRHSIDRLLSKDGKERSAAEKEKEQKRVDKQIADLNKREAKREEGHDDEDDITIERFLKISRLSNERREMRNGHEAIACDFTGDPDAKAHGMAENAIKKLSGTIWIDEDKRQIMRMEARFDDSFKVGGGLLASLQKGSNFIFEQALVNDEVWLPTYAEATFGARVLLFKSIHEHHVARYNDYRKFRSKTSITLADPEKPQ